MHLAVSHGFGSRIVGSQPLMMSCLQYFSAAIDADGTGFMPASGTHGWLILSGILNEQAVACARLSGAKCAVGNKSVLVSGQLW